MVNRKTQVKIRSNTLPTGARPVSHQERASGRATPGRTVTQETLGASGKPLDSTTRGSMEKHFGSDFSHVRVHTDDTAARSARHLNAAAYTFGGHIAFAQDAYAPGSAAGLKLLAHELAHVVQQGNVSASSFPQSMDAAGQDSQEQAADEAAENVMHGTAAPKLTPTARPTLQRKIRMRDVGRRGQSGFARLPELIKRLNAVSGGLTFSMDGTSLAYEVANESVLTNFDRQMMEFIDRDPVIPMRLTNSQGMLVNRETGQSDQVVVDSWATGYVDVDDLLASSDLGLQLQIVHVLRERTETQDYARRAGSKSLRQDREGEFDRAHRRGIDSEIQLLRDFFSDQSIRLESESTDEVTRVYRNGRRELFRVRVSPGKQGVNATSIEVVTRDRRVHTPEEYLQLREEERRQDEIERERMQQAIEDDEDDKGTPPP